jgi:hypothetical protein
VSWDEPRTETLKRRWAEGATGQQIADELGQGLTRSAVLGKVSKLGLNRHKEPSPHMPRPRLTREQAEASLAAYEKKHGKRGMRKAFAALGDDTTFSRFVKVPHEAPTGHPKGLQFKLPGFGGSIEAGRSVFHNRGVKPASAFKHMLVSGHSNVKIGNDVRVGRLFRGYWIYTLTLEERATCPVSCHHWRTCYGNNMPFAKRIAHGPELMRRLEAELPTMLAVRGRAGVLVRLHALGDFWSVKYVGFWDALLRIHPNLAVFGYTARRSGDPIGDAIALVKARHGRRFAIRWSDGGGAEDCTVSLRPGQPKPDNAFVCPEQTGKVAGCGKCGLCWNKTKNVAFIEH